MNQSYRISNDHGKTIFVDGIAALQNYNLGDGQIIVSQSTGITDVQENQIFEGDYILASERAIGKVAIYVVRYDTEYAAFVGLLIKCIHFSVTNNLPLGELRFDALVLGNEHIDDLDKVTQKAITIIDTKQLGKK